MRETVDNLFDLPTMGHCVALVSLRRLQNHFAQLTKGAANECALICIRQNYPGGSRNPLAVLLESLVETSSVTRLPTGLTAVVGNDLVCLLPGCSEFRALKFARMIRVKAQMSGRFGTADRPQFGIGIVQIGGESNALDELLALADLACREAERKGGSYIEVYRAAGRAGETG